MLVDREAAAVERLQRELDLLLSGADDPAIFEERLYALARDTVVLDSVGFVRLAGAHLPRHAATLRAAARRVRRRLALSAAIECDQAGYSGPAATHLLRAALAQPGVVCRRRSLGILARCVRRGDAHNRRLLQRTIAIFRLFAERGVHACLFGSLAISLHARRFVKQHGDIDMVFATEADADRAAALLAAELDYRVVRRHHWSGLTGERCFHVALRSPDGIPIELSYLPENPEVPVQRLVMDGVTLCLPSLPGLRRIYALFLVAKATGSHDVEKQSKKNAIAMIDRLLQRRA